MCTLEARSAVGVRVQDAVTDAFIASGATLVLQDGAFVDSVSFPADEPEINHFALVTPNTFERAGVYTATVRRAGYADWVREDIVVTEGRCHVNSVGLTARLTPLP